MNNKEFLNEIVDYIKNEYTEFEQYQDVALSILREVDRVLTKHSVPYTVSNGTLLGFVRDKQIVPWDYDIDIATPICYKEELLNALRMSLGENYYYKYIDNTPDYPTTCLRVSKVGYSFMAIHVDVFFVIGVPSDTSKRDKFFNSVQRWTSIRTEKYIKNYIAIKKDGWIKQMIYAIKSACLSCIPDCYLRRKEEKICTNVPFEKSEYCISFAHHRDGIELHRSDFFRKTERISLPTVGECSIMKEYDKYLKVIFGEWGQYLSIQNRFDEFYKMKKIVEERQAMYTKSLGEH